MGSAIVAIAAGGGGGRELGNIASATWPAANDALFWPFLISVPTIVRKLWVYNGATVSGNFDIGIYTEDGKQVIAQGSVAQAGASVLQVFDPTDFLLQPAQYYMALAFNNTTATVFQTGTLTNASVCRMLGATKQATAFPLPTTATFAAYTASRIPICGLSTRAVLN
jgi:hypothetical protein